jgi:UDP-N-acetylmuramoyl-tripeptide--D-alanyl-D-alanine ligase
MNELYILTTTAFFLWTIREIFFWVAVWQQNDYRFDRFFLYLKARSARKELLYSIQAIMKYILFLGYTLIIFYDKYTTIYYVFVILLYYYQAGVVIKDIYKNSLKKPLATPRSIIIVLLSFSTIVLLYTLQLMDKFFWLILIDILIGVIVTIFVLIFGFPTEIYADIQIEKAAKRIEENQKITVIGVTGSYGKSATKDYLASILEKKFKVLKTQEKNNTAFSIANTILKKLTNKTQIFIAEIGGYKQGEVKAVTDFIHPKIGVVTGINDKYIKLFGNLENKKKANFELLQALPKKGLAVCNGSNKEAVSLYKKTKTPKILYGKNKQAEITLIKYSEKRAGASLDINIKGKTLHIPSTRVRLQDIEALLPAIYVAQYLGMKESEIKKAVAKLK